MSDSTREHQRNELEQRARALPGVRETLDLYAGALPATQTAAHAAIMTSAINTTNQH